MHVTGRFGANHVPDILKPVEILGIIQARKWQVGSLNEFRQFFKLKKYETFEEINPDPYVAKTLKKLYGHPNQVEMYPGIFLEAAKPRMDPGMGLCKDWTPQLSNISLTLGAYRCTVFGHSSRLLGRNHLSPRRPILDTGKQTLQPIWLSNLTMVGLHALEPHQLGHYGSRVRLANPRRSQNATSDP